MFLGTGGVWWSSSFFCEGGWWPFNMFGGFVGIGNQKRQTKNRKHQQRTLTYAETMSNWTSCYIRFWGSVTMVPFKKRTRKSCFIVLYPVLRQSALLKPCAFYTTPWRNRRTKNQLSLWFFVSLYISLISLSRSLSLFRSVSLCMYVLLYQSLPLSCSSCRCVYACTSLSTHLCANRCAKFRSCSCTSTAYCLCVSPASIVWLHTVIWQPALHL